MVLARRLLPAALAIGFAGSTLSAQEATGSITGRVVDSASNTPLSNVIVLVEGTARRALSRDDGTYLVSGVPVGTQRVRARRIGFGAAEREVSVTDNATATVNFTLQPQAAVLSDIVVTGYGSQRREAITGSVAIVDANAANVGVISNANDLIDGRVAGVQITQNSGEPGAGAQIRIRGGTSITASNEPLYVIDGVAISNVQSEPGGIGIGGSPSLPRSPLNLLNPSDIESITILKDAAATAIYGSRAANGVILIETKKGSIGATSMEYDTYVAMATPARSLDVLNGAEYRAFIQEMVDAGEMPATRLTDQGTANTNWEDEVTRSAATHNHNLSFAGGGRDTRYRASLNYMNQQGVVLANGLERYQGRLNGTHQTFGGRLRLGLNLTASHVKNDYLPFENTGGFEGGVFANMVMFNPTRPVTLGGGLGYYELGSGRQSVRNPVALAEQVNDEAHTTRTLASVTSGFDLLQNLTAQLNVGVDRGESVRRIYLPAASPVGAEWNGRASQVQRDNQSLTLTTLLTYNHQVGAIHDFEVVGGYEYNEYGLGEFGAEGRNFLTDAFSFNNLGGGADLVRPYSWRNERRLVSFFTRANYGLKDRYFITGVLRRDGSSNFGEGNKWAVFPAISASWRLSSEDFMAGSRFSDLRLRAGWGLTGNADIAPYSSLILLETSARYPFGDAPVTGVAPVRNPNPDLKWEETSQSSVAVDFALREDRLRGTIEYYVKNTSDLLLTVPVSQPANVGDRIENVGKVRNRGLEISLEAPVVARPNLDWRASLVFAAERNKVVDLGPHPFLPTASVSGQGMSGQNAQRILAGHPLGTFFGPEFVGVNAAGVQVFNDYDDNGVLVGTTTSPLGNDRRVIGNANPDFTLGLGSQAQMGNFDLSFLIRSDQGRDVFNNTALVYATKTNALQDKNFLASALADADSIGQPSIYSSRWIEDGSFVRLQNVTIGYTLPRFIGQARNARVYLSGDNLLLLTGYSGYDPEVHADAGLASRGIDYLAYPRPRTYTAGVRFGF